MAAIGVLLFPGAEELDFVGPWEVLTVSSMLLENSGGHADEVFTVAERPGELRCAKGLRVMPGFTFDRHPHLDVVLVPGGRGTRAEVENQVLVSWLARVAEECEWVTSVCTGALLLHEAGPGRGRRLATHRGFEETLEARGDCTVVRDERWVVDGRVVNDIAARWAA